MNDIKNLESRILIVDDLQVNIDLVEQVLNQDGYFNLASTTDSRQVVELVKKFDPHLILLDLKMPHLSGIDVIHLIREMIDKSTDPGKYIPILVLTADINPETKLEALRAGAKDFISKPFDLIELRLRIKNLLETQLLFQLLRGKNLDLEEKIINFLKINDEWYR